jgi:RNA polymerase sigma-70 factor (ECF subfamily)
VANLPSHEQAIVSGGLFFPPQPQSVPEENIRAEGGSGQSFDLARLTGRMAVGDEAAYRLFYELYFNRLLRYLLVVTGGREDAARDALQLTLLRTARYMKQFNSEEVFWSWLTVLARSSVVDEERKRKRYLSLLERFFQREQLKTSVTDSEAEAHLMKSLEKGLAGLLPQDRELVEQKYFEGESVREIGGQTGSTEKSVESRLVRIRRRLKDAILRELKHEK